MKGWETIEKEKVRNKTDEYFISIGDISRHRRFKDA
jgi:hypothetical protein